MLIDQRRDPGVESDLFSLGGAALRQCLNQRILSQLAVLIVFIGRPAALDPPGNPSLSG